MRGIAIGVLVAAALVAGGARANGEECDPRAPDVAAPGVDGASCDSLALYYGIARPRDFAAARACAYAERADPQHFGLDGPGVLMMIHANGEGVPRDIALAKSFACEMGWAQYETKLRFAQLDAMAADPAAAGRIDSCDHITSGMMQGICALLFARMDAALRDARYAALARGWTPPQKQVLAELRKVATGYFGSSASGELDQSGSGHVAFSTERSEELESGLILGLERLEQGRLPGGGRDAAQRADAHLDNAYAETMEQLRAGEAAADRSNCFGTVKADDVRDTQRAWLQYRDAYVAFGRARHPSVPADAWIADLSNVRIYQLSRVDEPCSTD